METSLITIADYIRFAYSKMNGAELAYGHGFDNAWDESVFLVLSSLNLPWDFDQAFWSCRVTHSESESLTMAINRRTENKEPTAYIVQSTLFAGIPFYVDDRVLVPRSPIAELIAQDFMPWLQSPPAKVMDLCAGSGCIGIASAIHNEASEVSLVDISEEALEVARINVERLGVESVVTTYHSDLFSGLDQTHEHSYDLIVSNPPYVDQADIDSMPAEFHHEPMLGLAAGHDGLDLVKRILRDAARFLKADGLLVVELGNSWVALEEYYSDVAFTWIEFEHGGHGVFVMSATELKAREWS